MIKFLGYSNIICVSYSRRYSTVAVGSTTTGPKDIQSPPIIPLRNTSTWCTPSSKLYTDHIPTSGFQKFMLATGSSLLALYNPERADMVATLGETTGRPALEFMLKIMEGDPVGRAILEERPRINSQTVDPDWLKTLPDESFGKVYYKFMKERNFVADERPTVHFIDSEKLAYVMVRYREVHDFWHVITGLDTTVLDEIGLKYLEFLKTGLPMCALSGLFGPLRLNLTDKLHLIQNYIPWAIQTAYKTPHLMNIYYEHNLEKPIVSLRRDWGFIKPPSSHWS